MFTDESKKLETNVMIWPVDPAKNAIQGNAPEGVTHSGGSYERKSRGRKLADEMGRGKKYPIILS